MVEKLGRKIMPGDVFELPHLRDDLRLEAAMITLTSKPTKKFRKGETVTGGTSGVTGTVIDYNHDAKTIRITTAGLFTANETVTGETSSATQTVSSFTPSENLAINKLQEVKKVMIQVGGHIFGDVKLLLCKTHKSLEIYLVVVKMQMI